MSILISPPFQILIDRGIHGNLITFVALLLAYNVFHLHDIITYILRPIMRIELQHPDAAQYPTTPSAVDFVNSLILHLFAGGSVGRAGAGHESSIVLPQFVQHCLDAKCRDLNLGYVLMLMKDLVKLNPIKSLSGTKSDVLLVHSSSTGSDMGLGKVSLEGGVWGGAKGDANSTGSDMGLGKVSLEGGVWGGAKGDGNSTGSDMGLGKVSLEGWGLQ
jgi:hypothetical protein